MSTIQAYTSYNDLYGKHYYRNFDIKTKVPEVGDTLFDGTFKVVGVNSVSLDCEQGDNKVYNYNYYEIEYIELDSDCDDVYVWYIAIKKEEGEG